MTSANWWWCAWICMFAAVELWSILTGNYGWTLSKTLRDACKNWEWFAPVFVGILAWLAYHITVQKKTAKVDKG